MKKTNFNRYENTAWPPQCHNFGSTAGAGGFTVGVAALAVKMLEEALGSAELHSDQPFPIPMQRRSDKVAIIQMALCCGAGESAER